MAALLLIPLLSLAGLWGFTASITLGNVIRNQHYNTLVNTIAPSVVGLEKTLEPERALTLLWLSTGRQSPRMRSQLLAARRDTNVGVAEARTATESVRGLLSATGQAKLRSFLTELAGLARIRAAVDAGTDSPVAAFAAYSAISTTEYGFLRSATPPVDPTLDLMTQASIAEVRAEDLASGAIALVNDALAAHGQMTQPERAQFDQLVGEQNFAIADTFSLATPGLAELFRRIFDSPGFHRFLTTESQIINSPAGRPVPLRPSSYQDTTLILHGASSSFDQPRIGNALAAESARLSDSLLTELYLGGGLGLAAVVLSVIVMMRLGRRLRAELTGLYKSARQMADEQLPHLVEQLRRGEEADITAESSPPRPARITEIANVARAFSSVQRTAVEAAVGQASLRKGVNQVFVSLSLRNQSLLHRQLGMLDDMERATTDSDALANLFRLDHLTTRMRRHAESLLILAGATPGRGWQEPVPVADVLNAAVAEVEDYVRVDVACEPANAVVGPAVNDVIHLLAELVENATTFSPPNTSVEIRGDTVGQGFAVEIEDRGLGMPAEEIVAHNERLATPPEFDLASSDQLGLFVAATLAARHQIRVSLRPSPFGGTTAIVLLPPGIMVTTPDEGQEPEALGEPIAPWVGGWFSRGGADRDNADSSAVPIATRIADTQPSDATGDGTEFDDPAADGSRPNMPRRVRQASLAPQLRRNVNPAVASPSREPEWSSPAVVSAGSLGRSPEEASDMLSALQAGWEQARTEDLGYPDGEDHR